MCCWWTLNALHLEKWSYRPEISRGGPGGDPLRPGGVFLDLEWRAAPLWKDSVRPLCARGRGVSYGFSFSSVSCIDYKHDIPFIPPWPPGTHGACFLAELTDLSGWSYHRPKWADLPLSSISGICSSEPSHEEHRRISQHPREGFSLRREGKQHFVESGPNRILRPPLPLTSPVTVDESLTLYNSLQASFLCLFLFLTQWAGR